MKPEDVKFEITLTKSKTYQLKPYGKFNIKFTKTTQNLAHRTIPVMELKMEHETSYPMTPEQEEEFIAEMKKYKTDVFTDGSYFGFFTRTGSGMTRIYHTKLQQYTEDDVFKSMIDNNY